MIMSRAVRNHSKDPIVWGIELPWPCLQVGLCFVGKRRRFGDFVSGYLEPPTGGTGPIMAAVSEHAAKKSGGGGGVPTLVGGHKGLWRYTLGQGAAVGGQPPDPAVLAAAAKVGRVANVLYRNLPLDRPINRFQEEKRETGRLTLSVTTRQQPAPSMQRMPGGLWLARMWKVREQSPTGCSCCIPVTPWRADHTRVFAADKLLVGRGRCHPALFSTVVSGRLALSP